MDIVSICRILRDSAFRNGVRQHARNMRRTGARVGALLNRSNRPAAKYVMRDFGRYLVGARPVAGETRERARAAVDWLLRAQDASPDGGVAHGYYPCDPRRAWHDSYPETTGYIITSLLEYSRRYEACALLDRARRMADWEIEVQMPGGAVQGGTVTTPDKQKAATFNTGMVLDGLSSIFRETHEPRYFEAARKAADFLVGDLGDDGHFRTHGTFVNNTGIKTYNSLCAWALYRFGDDSDENCYRHAAIRAIDAAVGQQTENGWFANNCFIRGEAPLLHSIGYTLQAILEVGLLAGRDDFIAAARRGTDPLISRMSHDGFLHGRFYSDWRPALFSSCLTGSAQLAIVCYRLAEHLGEPSYREAADRLVNHLKRHQVLDSSNPALNGALAGSFPFFGDYVTAGFPNWATKFFLDALMLQDRAAEG